MSSQGGEACELVELRKRNLHRMLHAKSVAFFGGKTVLSGVQYLEELRFKGKIWIVNPVGARSGDSRFYRSVDELPGVPDASVIATPPEVAIRLVGELAQVGAPGAICYTAGFAEIGPEGAALEHSLAAAAGRMALVGPNCTGFTNLFDRIAATVVNHGLSAPTRGVAIVAQSGTIPHNAAMSARKNIGRR